MRRIDNGAQVPWASAAVMGAALGVLSASLVKRRKPGASLATAAIAGSVLGLGAGALWASRRPAGAAIQRARDVWWLDRHPIDYA